MSSLGTKQLLSQGGWWDLGEVTSEVSSKHQDQRESSPKRKHGIYLSTLNMFYLCGIHQLSKLAILDPEHHPHLQHPHLDHPLLPFEVLGSAATTTSTLGHFGASARRMRPSGPRARRSYGDLEH